jgi:hypothetical protein
MFKTIVKTTSNMAEAIDFQDGNLICIAPNQTIEIDNEIEHREICWGWGLFFTLT